MTVQDCVVNGNAEKWGVGGGEWGGGRRQESGLCLPHLSIQPLIANPVEKGSSFPCWKVLGTDRGCPQKDKTHRRQCKMSSYKKLTYKETLRLVFICLRPGAPSPPPHSVYVYTVFLFTQGRGGQEESLPREKVRGATVHKSRQKIPTGLTVSPVYKL